MIRKSKQEAWIKIALLNFITAGIFGTIMRYDFVKEIPWINYVHMESAHWHIAIFGWIYLALFSLLIGTFLPIAIRDGNKYNNIFRGIQGLIILDIIVILLKGYNFVSMGIDVCLLLFILYFI